MTAKIFGAISLPAGLRIARDQFARTNDEANSEVRRKAR